MPIISMVQRDIEGNANGNQAVEAQALGNGLYAFGIGYLPGLAESLPGDVKIIATTETPVTVGTLEEDENFQYVTLTPVE